MLGTAPIRTEPLPITAPVANHYQRYRANPRPSSSTMSQPDPMDEDGAAFAPAADQEPDISQAAAAFQAATAPPPTTDATGVAPSDGALASLSATQGAAAISTESPQFPNQPQPISPAAAAATAPSPAAQPAAAAAAATATATGATAASSPLPPPRTGTPTMRSANPDAGSRATSQHPPDSGFVMPAEATPHGAPARRYLNTKVTGVLLEGMKLIAKEQFSSPPPFLPHDSRMRVSEVFIHHSSNHRLIRPKDPLRVLGEFLLQRSKELEPAV
ncbi:hypothetical protein RB598_009124 [Gaeumannomyces tritici]